MALAATERRISLVPPRMVKIGRVRIASHRIRSKTDGESHTGWRSVTSSRAVITSCSKRVAISFSSAAWWTEDSPRSTARAMDSAMFRITQKVAVALPVEQKVSEYFESTGNMAAINTVDLVARVQGFAIGGGRTHSHMDVHDTRDGEDLYRVLLDEVIPLYYHRDRDGLPRGWITRMKRTIRTLGWRFSADRMVMDYTRNCYVPAAGGTSSEMKPPA